MPPKKNQGKQRETEESTTKKTLAYWSKLPLQSQEKKFVTHELHSAKGYVNVFGVHEEENNLDLRESDPTLDNWNKEPSDSAGPSQTIRPMIYGIEIVSDSELAQLAQVRPLTNNHESSVIQDCFKMLEKKAAEYEIIKEFMSLDEMSEPLEFCCGNEPCNRDKNRYRDILPYDSTRVSIGENKDYINASYIKIGNSEEEYFYIATQGPLIDTTNDFWQMVLESNTDVIVMITKEKESGVIKCHRYWPVSPTKPLELKECHISLENYQILDYFIIRLLKVVKKSTGVTYNVRHVQFTNWPDHGTPASSDDFVKYVRYVRKNHISGPIVVHCSAGVGRTGVFICVDVVFCSIEKNLSFNIRDIVTQMREQRPGMIQTKEQYSFCYRIVLQILRKLYTQLKKT